MQIIDEFTGRALGGRRFSDGLHQAIEAKENVRVEEENQTLAAITYQYYFKINFYIVQFNLKFIEFNWDEPTIIFKRSNV